MSSYREGRGTHKAGARLIVLDAHKWIIIAALDWRICTHINIKHICIERNLTFNTFPSLYSVLFTGISSFCFFLPFSLTSSPFLPLLPVTPSLCHLLLSHPAFPFSLQFSWSSPVCLESIPEEILLTFIGGEFIPSTRLQTTPMHAQHTWVHTNSRIDEQQWPYQAIPLPTGSSLETMHWFSGTTNFAGMHRDTLSFHWLPQQKRVYEIQRRTSGSDYRD